MINLHFRVQMISRGQGQSAVASAAYRAGAKLSVLASAAYRSGAKLHSDQERHTFDYTHKEDVLHTEIVTPARCPAWAQDRERLWNEVEASEKRKDAQLARDIIAALPRHLSHEQQVALVREFVQDNFVRDGMIADFAIHDVDASDGGRNPHTHIMLTTREIGPEGFGKKNRDWNQRNRVGDWRTAWETIGNRYLEEIGSEYRVTTQSYDAQGIDTLPGAHMGPKAAGLERKGTDTVKGDHNREVKHRNAVRDMAKTQRRRHSHADRQTASSRTPDQQLSKLAQHEAASHADTSSTERHPPQGQAALLAASATENRREGVAGTGDEEAAHNRQEDARRALAASMVQRTAQATMRAAVRVRDYTRQMMRKTGAWLGEQVAADKERSGSIFDRYISQASAFTQKERDERGYER